MKDPIIDALFEIRTTKDEKPKDCAVLWGHVSPDPDSPSTLTRLYLTLNMDEYLVIRTDDILHQIPLYNTYHVLGGTLVYVLKETEVARVREETAQQESDFLKGKIARGFLSGSGASSLIGFASSVTGPAEPGSGGGCGSGSPSAACE